LATENCHIKGQWKKSKRVLIEHILTFNASKDYQDQIATHEDSVISSVKTVSALIDVLVTAGLTYREIVVIVKKKFPEARTTTRSVASTVSRRRRSSCVYR